MFFKQNKSMNFTPGFIMVLHTFEKGKVPLLLKCTLCQVQKVCVLVNIAIFIWIVLLAALSYPFAYPAVGVKVTAGEAEPMP